MEISLWFPTFTHDDPDFRDLPARARRAEDLGFSGLVLLDHLLPISGVHTSAWLDTIVGLSVLASVTERVRLGTASMIVGFRHPVMLAKQLASVAVVAGPRVFLGASSGWYAPEYGAMGYSTRERRARTDETLEAVRRLLTEDHVTFEGAHWQFEDVTISPRPTFHVPFLVGGGSRRPEAGSDRDLPSMSPGVLKRICRWDGWIAPCAGDEQLTYRDLDLVRQAKADAGGHGSFRVTHVQWTHFVETDDRDRALDEQFRMFRAMMGEHHTPAHLTDTYLLGTPEEIQARVTRLKHRGFEELILGPVTHDPRQVELIARHLIHEL
jgi:alkanesulfonate monooxygenase SsuD/methylene tetrahydromethanopterin reductase-like flavin-dependent oxidoreductase (luciferase family)